MDGNIMKRAQDWSAQNPEMDSVTVPAGYNAHYLYQLPAIVTDETSAEYEDMGGWGIVSLEADHRLTQQEMEEYQASIENEGGTCLDDIRLVKQIFTYKR